MTGNRKQAVEIGVISVFFILLAWYMESERHLLDEENRIARAKPGDGSTSVSLSLDAEGLLEDYAYTLDIVEMAPTGAEAKRQLTAAEQEIAESFFAAGENADCVTQAVSMRESYVGQLVRAEWTLDSYRYVNADGKLVQEEIPEEGVPVLATAELSCGNYTEAYSFPFRVFPSAKSPEELLLAHVDEALAGEQEQEGKDYLKLPEEVDGYKLRWSQAKEHLVVKVVFFEAVILVLLFFVRKERIKEREKLRGEEMMLDYAEVVNKLLILLGSGMSLKQAWNRISARYIEKRERNKEARRHIYEEMAVTNYEIQDGESERNAYQRFAERTGLGPYYRLVRILLQNLQTGSRGLCKLLEQEAESALEERKALARKLGEEAGTRMLLPLMMMLGIVIAIIMAPAIQSFRM